MKSFTELLATHFPVCADGAWGTQLFAAGLPVGACPELWNIEYPDRVQHIAAGYLQAGAQIIKTNTFGANRYRLESYQLPYTAQVIAAAGARISKAAANGTALVAGSVGPTGKIPGIDELTDAEYIESFTEQIGGLLDSGVDMLLLETFYSAMELSLALQAAANFRGTPVICSATYNAMQDGSYKTMCGDTPRTMLETALAGGAAVVGANCGFGIQDTIRVLAEYRAIHADAALCAMPNAGMPEINNGILTYPETPEYFKEKLPELLQLQPSIIGGCCGTTPRHIAVIRTYIDNS